MTSYSMNSCARQAFAFERSAGAAETLVRLLLLVHPSNARTLDGACRLLRALPGEPAGARA